MGTMTPEYYHKMYHKIPPTSVVGREEFILKECDGKVVLDIGCAGPFSQHIKAKAKEWHGFDVLPGEWNQIDLDSQEIGIIPDIDLIVCGEILEHLSNPGFFLDNLRKSYGGRKVIFTVPNAFASPSYQSVKRGVEMVNRDHVAYYSWWTLSNLLERYGYKIREWYWYNGQARVSEGLIMVAEC